MIRFFQDWFRQNSTLTNVVILGGAAYVLYRYLGRVYKVSLQQAQGNKQIQTDLTQ